VFDYRHFGDSEGEPRQLLDIGRQQDDYRAAVAYARTRAELDPDRVVLWGSSFSGGHVISVAAGDPSIAAVIAQSPFADGMAQARATPPGQAIRISARALRDQVAGALGRPPVHIPVLGRPGSVAALTSPDSEPGFRAMLKADSRWGEEIAARVMLRVTAYRPVRAARRVTAPLLVCVADRDDLTPPEPGVRMAEAAPRGELRRYPCGHFDVYAGTWHDQLVADEVAFLQRHLG
jgi:pimeloyl-ACP methyl ester carboxylesterase